MKHIRIILIPLFISLIAAVQVGARESDSEATYIKITPGLVVNYGEPSTSRLRYLKVSVHVRVQNISDAEIVEHHLPALQDALVMILSSQDEGTISSAHGKEEIRLAALAQFQKVIKREEGLPIIQDLLFGSFIVQR